MNSMLFVMISSACFAFALLAGGVVAYLAVKLLAHLADRGRGPS